jgi:hypothetical protein
VNHKVIGGGNNLLTWAELLVTPVMEKVNQTEVDGVPVAQAEFVEMGWNQSINLKDPNAVYAWEIDTNTETLTPVDLYSDIGFLNGGGGPYGAQVSAGNPDLTSGFGVFAPVGECSVSLAPCEQAEDCAPGACNNGGGGGATALSCHTDADCEAVASGSVCVGAQTCNPTAGQASKNGKVGGDRVGRNSCFFTNNMPTGSLNNLGLASPQDDDLNNDAKVCSGLDALGNAVICVSNKDCEVADAPVGGPYSCVVGDALTDEFVTPAGPLRNHHLEAWNGPDMRFFTLEDIYGDTGNLFQAGIGFITFEGEAAQQAVPSYGLAVDDVVVQWREFTLELDATNCVTSGACATLDLDVSNVFDGQAVLYIRAMESTPPVDND